MRTRVWAAGVLISFLTVSSPLSAEREFKPSERSYWAYQKVVKPQIPAVKNQAWAQNEIDALILTKLEAKNLQPNPPADKVTLLRRATMDLTGLLPTAEEVQAFLQDTSPDAFAKVVDRLLASPHYGERWARHWLDLARYADTGGFRADETRRNVWRYRDYVIDSLNQDKPYDRFIQEQIAGDEMYPEDPQARLATGFNRLWPEESNVADPMLQRQDIMNDITDTVGSVFMGMTYGCARCHDHKFDAILHKDYYRLQAFFVNSTNDNKSNLLAGAERQAYDEQYAVWDAKTRHIRDEIAELVKPVRKDRLKKTMAIFPAKVVEAYDTPAEQRTPMQWQIYYRGAIRAVRPDDSYVGDLEGEAKARYEVLKKEMDQYADLKPADPPIGEVMIDVSKDAPPTHVLAVGSYDSPLEEVEPGFLTILDPSPAKIVPPAGMNSTGRRTALANWLTQPDNPLTARVMVNRLWHYHFGQGIVGSPSDFGVMGERPTHPELLDYLAARFVENGWSIKKMHRMMMLSNTYQQSSAQQPEAAAVDPSNRLRWRFERRRLEGEAIRDAMLQLSGNLNPKMHGPGIFPPLPEDLAQANRNWKAEKDPAEAARRSVYVFAKRTLGYPMFETMDQPDPYESCARRYNTVTPTQSLALLNDQMVLEWSQALAGRVLNDAGMSVESQVERAYRIVYNRAPNSKELQATQAFLETQKSILREQLAAGSEKIYTPATVPDGMEPAHAAAVVDFCHVLLNSNEFVYMN